MAKMYMDIGFNKCMCIPFWFAFNLQTLSLFPVMFEFMKQNKVIVYNLK